MYAYAALSFLSSYSNTSNSNLFLDTLILDAFQKLCHAALVLISPQKTQEIEELGQTLLHSVELTWDRLRETPSHLGDHLGSVCVDQTAKPSEPVEKEIAASEEE